jgi:hypothetical protein
MLNKDSGVGEVVHACAASRKGINLSSLAHSAHSLPREYRAENMDAE